MAEIPGAGPGGLGPFVPRVQQPSSAGKLATNPAAGLTGKDDDALSPAGEQELGAPEEKGDALGAGGASSGGMPGDGDLANVKRVGSSSKMAGTAAAVPAAGAAGQVMLLAMFINYLKGMMMSLMAIGANLLNLAVGLGLAIGKAALGSMMAVGASVSAAVGGAISTAVAGAVSFTAGGLVVGVAVAGAVIGITNGDANAMRDGSIGCKPAAQQALAKIAGSNGNVDAATLTNAQTIYSVLSAWGMPDENIAGIIGNWDAESGIDPTSVQGNFDSPQAMSPTKLQAAGDSNNGIGLGQWTFGRNTALQAYATAQSQDWWTINVQLGFLISAAEGANATVVKNMITTSQGTPTAAALYFHDNWERSADTPSMEARRGTYAEKWMGMFSGWSKNQALANSILAQAGTTLTSANTSRAAAVRSNCLSAGAAQTALVPGGLTLAQAQQFMDVYKQTGEAFLDARYPSGGPDNCGYGKADNCVGFSTYFVNKYTSFQQYASGNGGDLAMNMAQMMGKTTSHTPTVYSVASASGPGFSSDGHTFVVLGIQGDQAVIGQAACGTNGAGTNATTIPVSTLTNGQYTFVDVSDLITTQPASS